MGDLTSALFLVGLLQVDCTLPTAPAAGGVYHSSPHAMLPPPGPVPLFGLLQGRSPKAALEHTAGAYFEVMRATSEAEEYELQLVAESSRDWPRLAEIGRDWAGLAERPEENESPRMTGPHTVSSRFTASTVNRSPRKTG